MLCCYLKIYTTILTCSPAEMQYHTSLYSLAVQIPCLFFLIDWKMVWNLVMSGDTGKSDQGYIVHMALLYLINGVFFHFQTITAYVLMDFISPVTHR